MKIAVTGASGHIGSNLCPELYKLNHQLRLLKHRDKVFSADGVEIVEGDLNNEGAIDALVKGAEVVIHLAAKISISGRDREELFEVNNTGTRNVVDACLDNQVKRLIHFSTIHAYNPYPLDQPLNETRELVDEGGTDYDLSKVEGEKYALQAISNGLEVVVLTPTSVYGPNDNKPSLLGNAIIDIYNGKVPTLVPGGYDFVDVRDIVRGVISAIDKGENGEKYLFSGHYLTVKELARKIGEIGGVKVTQRVLSSWVLKMLIPVFQIQSRLSNKPPIFTSQSLKALVESNRMISSEKAVKELGYSITAIDDSIRETLDWFKSNGNLKNRK